MSRAYVTNLAHFLDEKGALPLSLPKKARKLIENMGIIISSVTSKPDSPLKIKLTCWSTLYKKRCIGKIDASIDARSFGIFWHCLECGNHGSISNWKNTFLDHGHR